MSLSFLEKIKSRDPVPEAQFRWHGKLAGFQYGTRKGTEYAVELRASDPATYKPDQGEISVTRRRTEMLDGTPWETTFASRGWPVPVGTYDRLSKARKAGAEKPMRAWDRLARLPAMQHRPPRYMATGPASSVLDRLPPLPAPPSEQEQEALAGVVNLALGQTSRLLEVGGHEPPQPSGFVPYFVGKGIELTLARGRVIARSTNPINAADLELLDLAEPLIVGELGGPVPSCALCDQPATSIAIPRAPVCQGHQ